MGKERGRGGKRGEEKEEERKGREGGRDNVSRPTFSVVPTPMDSNCSCRRPI
jgi:hypothetical protein